MKLWAALFATSLLAVATVRAEAVSGRFSQSLSVAERTEAGFNHLSSDQIAVIDALIRRDLAAQSRVQAGDETAASRFSQRLTNDERRTAGLTLLSEAELARLDALAGRNVAAVAARKLLSAPVFVAPGARLNPEGGGKIAPEIHGTVSLSYGWSKGGGNEKTGAMNVRFEDPAHGLLLQVGYSETHASGPFIYRDAGVPPLFLP